MINTKKQIKSYLCLMSLRECAELYRRICLLPTEIQTLETKEVIVSKSYSVGYKSAFLYLSRILRKQIGTSTVVEKSDLIRELAVLKNCVYQTMLVSENEFVEMSESTPDDSVSIESEGNNLELAISRVYEISVGRKPVTEEIEIWKNNFQNGLDFHDFFLSMLNSSENNQNGNCFELLPESTDETFIQKIYEILYDRGCRAWEMLQQANRLKGSGISRLNILSEIFNDSVRVFDSGIDNVPHDGLSCRIMGTNENVSVNDWNEKKKTLSSEENNRPKYNSRFHIKSESSVLVTAIASLYKGADFIDQFIENVTSQSCFRDFAELIIVDADSPENESETIKRFCNDHKNINYIKMNYRIGIYEAWNVGVANAKGKYLTNTNLDDLRREDSLELQAATLDNLPFVDVVYQDLYYTFDPYMSFDEIRRFDYLSRLPLVTPYTLMEFNSPHNAPMWRKSLHEELGLFDTAFKSAGDYEFWLRCLEFKKVFYKINDPNVIYYQNPKGLSTRSDSRGVVESKEIHKKYASKMTSKNLTMPLDAFCKKVDPHLSNLGINSTKNRYDFTQEALRSVAIKSKYGVENGK